MFIQPYLYFNGRCEEAINFYKQALGAEVTFMMRYDESPDPQSKAMMTPGTEKKIMHSNVQIRDTQIMMSDGRCDGAVPKFDGISLTVNVSADEAEKVFNALGAGGQVQMPLCETFFAHKFGMVADKFGVSWLLLAGKEPA
jgi:PhnB protein